MSGNTAGDTAGNSAGFALTAQLCVPRPEFDVVVDLRVEAGETLAVMGPSGAGKSSVLHAIAGIERLTEGRIVLGDRATPAPSGAAAATPTVFSSASPTATSAASTSVLADAAAGIHLPPHRRAIGMLGQDPRLFPHLTAHGNIAFGARAGGLSKRAAADTATEWLERLKLTEVSGQRPTELSGGQRQRIALARALAASPRLLLIDEPFASLDVEAAADVRELVREELARTRTTAIVVSHSAVDAVALAHRLIVIEQGRIVQQGAVREVLAAPATRFVAAVATTLPA
ncbi:ABC-type sulfate/molybdate transport systems ATPase subunit [Leucobacter exalbidus]|uniref:ABC-type sulfate/molybdate transport systems ATPase subunit n=1 Tax=Leucobacter exalbidus TaxID=662960 RepID=A0A940PVN2_9MICO|nr:ATP-binding cassette domain-containing protein [Leucobacter exalbidus]MBP1326139.1 ABC-type sulfate/molybdate transport systems ATPase subunit [Leucobacter exalbidus]